MIINQKYLKEYGIFPENYDLKEVMQYVPIAQEIWLKPLIGEDLLDELEEQVEEDDLSPENATLLTDGQLWRYLSMAVALEALPMLWVHLSQVGLTLGKSDNSDSISLKDLTLVQQHIRNQVEVLKESVKHFICSHQESFPSADLCSCGCSGCQSNNKLLKPNPLNMLYSTYRRCSNIR